MRVVVSCSGKFHAFALVEQLQKNGVDVVFFTSYSSIVNSFFKIIARRQDREVIDPKSIRTNLIIAFAIKLFRSKPQVANDLFDKWVSSKIKKMNADIFIGWSGMSLKTLEVAKGKGWKTILERGSTHIGFQNEILKVEYLKRGIEFSIDQKTISKEIMEYSLVDKITIPSGFVELTFKNKGFDKNKLFVNHFGASQFFIKRKDANTTKFRLLYLGTFSIRKGAYYLFDAINELVKYNIEFWFIGKTEPEVTHLMIELKKLEAVKFFGHVNHYELNSLIEQCSIAVHPSLEEGQSMVINQVMKVGVPFIATPNSGAEELVVNNLNGVIIEPKSSEAIVDAILDLYLNREKLKFLTRNVEEMNLVDNSWDSYGKRYVEMISSDGMSE
jgi:glycosyltransferase involved in cell wall biosynthesis